MMAKFEDGLADAFQSGPCGTTPQLLKLSVKTILVLLFHPTVNIGGQDVNKKPSWVKLYAVNQTPFKGNAERIAASTTTRFTSKDSQNNQFTNEDRHIIPANKEVQAPEAVQKDAPCTKL